MAWREIDGPLVGKNQVYNPTSGRVLIDLYTYLLYLQDNLNVPKTKNTKSINGVVGETMTIPVMTATNAVQYNNEAQLFQPIVFPTNGTMQFVVTTPANLSVPIHIMINAMMTCVVAQASVFPAISFQVEIFNTKGNGQTSNGATGLWQVLPQYAPPYFYSAGSIESPVANAIKTLSLYYVIPDTLPNTQYRITALAGAISSSVAFPQTGQYKIDAVGTNTFEFVVWVGG